MSAAATVDMSVQVGSLTLPNPVMVASGTAGHSTELAAYLDLSALGAFVVKSLSPEPWDGNPGPRVHQTPLGMINSVGLQGPGIEAWLATGYPALRAAGVERIIVSIWGRSVEEYARAAQMLADAPPEVIGVEVNLSCPNLEGGRHLFAHDPQLSATVIERCAVADRPLWAKLSPNTDRLREVAGAVAAAGAESVTLTNTLLGMSIDIESRRPRLGSGAAGGGVSGPAIHPVAVRAVYDCRVAHPDLPIVGVGGVAAAADAIEFLLAGAQACQVGTATFADPRTPQRVADGIRDWCDSRSIERVRDLSGGAHG